MDSILLLSEHNEMRSLCRCCLSQNSQLRSLFVNNDNLNCLPSKVIAQMCDVFVCPNDNLPSQICVECLQKIHSAYLFKLQVINSERILKEHFHKARGSSSANVIKSLTDLLTQKFYDCSTCDKKFSTEFNLIRHSKICRANIQQESNIIPKKEVFTKSNDDIVEENFNIALNSLIDMSQIDIMLKGEPSLNYYTENIDVLNVPQNKSKPLTVKRPKSMVSAIENASLLPDKRKSKRKCVKKRKIEDSLSRFKRSLKLKKGVFICDHCDVDFKDLRYLKEHIKVLESFGKFDCVFCGDKFEDKPSLTAHIAERHNLNKPYVCSHCQGQFTRWESLQIHIRCKHTMERIHNCTKCSKTFIQRRDLNRHLKSHDSIYSCYHCNKTFKYKFTLAVHKKSHLQNHIQHICADCNQVCSSENQLKRHRRVAHTGETHACPECNKVFTHASRLQKHRLSHTDRSKRPFKCRHCGKRFNFKQHLDVHERIHTQIKPYLCNLCGKEFVQSVHLKIHLESHKHKIINVCELCPMSFSDEKKLQNHVKKYHTDSNVVRKSESNVPIKHIVSGDRSKIKCTICQKMFSKMSQLKRHVQTHVKNVSSIDCKICKEKFTNVAEMNEHNKKVHKQKINIEKESRNIKKKKAKTEKNLIVSKSIKNEFSNSLWSEIILDAKPIESMSKNEHGNSTIGITDGTFVQTSKNLSISRNKRTNKKVSIEDVGIKSSNVDQPFDCNILSSENTSGSKNVSDNLSKTNSMLGSHSKKSSVESNTMFLNPNYLINSSNSRIPLNVQSATFSSMKKLRVKQPKKIKSSTKNNNTAKSYYENSTFVPGDKLVVHSNIKIPPILDNMSPISNDNSSVSLSNTLSNSKSNILSMDADSNFSNSSSNTLINSPGKTFSSSTCDIFSVNSNNILLPSLSSTLSNSAAKTLSASTSKISPVNSNNVVLVNTLSAGKNTTLSMSTNSNTLVNSNSFLSVDQNNSTLTVSQNEILSQNSNNTERKYFLFIDPSNNVLVVKTNNDTFSGNASNSLLSDSSKTLLVDPIDTLAVNPSDNLVNSSKTLLVNPVDTSSVNPSDDLINSSNSLLVNSNNSLSVNPCDNLLINPSNNLVIQNNSLIINPIDALSVNQSETFLSDNLLVNPNNVLPGISNGNTLSVNSSDKLTVSPSNSLIVNQSDSLPIDNSSVDPNNVLLENSINALSVNQANTALINQNNNLVNLSNSLLVNPSQTLPSDAILSDIPDNSNSNNLLSLLTKDLDLN